MNTMHRKAERKWVKLVILCADWLLRENVYQITFQQRRYGGVSDRI
jgi:hypothetical protein